MRRIGVFICLLYALVGISYRIYYAADWPNPPSPNGQLILNQLDHEDEWYINNKYSRYIWNKRTGLAIGVEYRLADVCTSNLESFNDIFSDSDRIHINRKARLLLDKLLAEHNERSNSRLASDVDKILLKK